MYALEGGIPGSLVNPARILVDKMPDIKQDIIDAGQGTMSEERDDEYLYRTDKIFKRHPENVRIVTPVTEFAETEMKSGILVLIGRIPDAVIKSAVRTDNTIRLKTGKAFFCFLYGLPVINDK